MLLAERILTTNDRERLLPLVDQARRSWLTYAPYLEALRVGAASGLVTGALAAGVAALLHWDHGPMLGVLVAVSLFVNQTVACAWGAAVPYVMRWLGQDPAQSATIFTTTLTDALGFFTLLGLSSMSLRVLG